jgi:dihydrofolate reductase
MISMISVTNKNRAIGYKNQLLWDIPHDLEYFKEITNGHVVIMGDKTFESLGRPLPNRTNIIVTRDKDYKAPDCIIVHSLEKALEAGKKKEARLGNMAEEVFIIGGGSIYAQMLPFTDKLYLTIVDDEPGNADTFFPDYSEFKNLISESEEYEYNGLKYKFIELTK